MARQDAPEDARFESMEAGAMTGAADLDHESEDAYALALFRSLPDEFKPVACAGLMIMVGQETRALERFGEEVVDQGRAWLAEVELRAAERVAPAN